MNVKKIISEELSMVYATSIMKINGNLHFVCASEGKGKCLTFREKSFEKSTIWDAPGGTMNIVPIPDRENEFIATQSFFPVFNAKESQIVYGKLINGKWHIEPIMIIPYLHRFDIFLLDNQLYFIGATLCTTKDDVDDWTSPGKVYVGKLNKEISSPFNLTCVLEGITKNHGFCFGEWEGEKAYFITGVEGVFIIKIPHKGKDKWETKQLFTHEVSDIAFCDIDKDGTLEIATIEPFHGSKATIYKHINGKWEPIFQYHLEFGHVVWGGKILDTPSFIIGERKGNKQLICVQIEKDSNDLKVIPIDKGGGPTNISVLNKGHEDYIISANRESDEAAIYRITK